MNIAILACVEQHVLHRVKSRQSSFISGSHTHLFAYAVAAAVST